MNTKHISTTDTAKIIRKVLKESFPGIKFSVRSKTYSGGSAINVDWTDGPTRDQVNAIVKCFEGASFNAYEDFKEYVTREVNGEKYSFGSDWVMTHREYSKELHDKALMDVCQRSGIENTMDEVNANPGKFWPILGDAYTKELDGISLCPTLYSKTFDQYCPSSCKKAA